MRSVSGFSYGVCVIFTQKRATIKIVNFNTVAKAAKVTRGYLYAYQEMRERIESLRTPQGQERLERQ